MRMQQCVAATCKHSIGDNEAAEAVWVEHTSEVLQHITPHSPPQQCNILWVCLQVVILSQVLACDATLGYEDYCNVQLLKFNGTPVNNLRHLTELVESCTETYMRFDLAYQVSHAR